MAFAAPAPPAARFRPLLGQSVARTAIVGARRPASRRTAGQTPTGRLGLPSVFGRRATTAAQTVAEPVVEVPPAPELSRVEQTAEWAKAHPFRAALFAVMLVVYVKRAVDAWRAGGGLAPPGEGSAGPAKSSSLVGAAAAAPRARATPRRHETTDEAMDLLGNTARKYIIVGGKGGVGKTSSSCAVATQFADRGQVTLIVSTDPAHSLSDAFDQPVSGGEPVPVIGIDNLYAQEINPENTKQSFNLMGGAGAGDALAGLGGDFGLDELNSLFDKLPPGFDEAAALAEIVKLLDGDPAYEKFERIVFDTAPTGHTLRLMSLPEFLNGFVGKIVSMKSKFQGVMNQFKGMFGSQDVDMDESFNDMEDLKRTMAKVRDLFTDDAQTEFIVTTIPNMMAIAESKRLVDELRSERVPVRHLFVNQLQPENGDCTFCSVRHKEQASNLKYIQAEFAGLRIATVQSFDREIRGIAALRAMGSQLFPSAEALHSSTGGDSGSRGTGAGVNGGATTVVRPPPSPPMAPTVKAEIVE
jgi:TRC40/GET3/ArsA family transport-energizing ATPase